jgi:orotidine-5'-phosphate decarboxylase
MMENARERLEKRSQRPLLVAVTILTSLTADEIAEVGYRGEPAENVLRLAKLTKVSGLDGVVCSPLEAVELRREIGPEFLLVTPGVRPKASTQDDQRRVMTPGEAIKSGSSYLVVGRPITASDAPIDALKKINAEIVEQL